MDYIIYFLLGCFVAFMFGSWTMWRRLNKLCDKIEKRFIDKIDEDFDEYDEYNDPDAWKRR